MAIRYSLLFQNLNTHSLSTYKAHMSSYPAFKRGALLFTSFGLICTAEANANPLNSLYVVPAAYYASPDSRLASDHDFGVQLSVGSYLSRQWQAELISEATKFKRDDGTNTYKQAGISAQAIFNPLDDLAVRPIFLGGFGALRTSSNAGNNIRPIVRAGAGLEWQIPNSPWGVRSTAIWRHEFNSSALSPSKDLNTYIYSLGISYRFGNNYQTPHSAQAERSPTTTSLAVATPSPVEKPVATSAPVHDSSVASATDQDGDGVPNTQDKCSDTPQIAVADADGCPVRLK